MPAFPEDAGAGTNPGAGLVHVLCGPTGSGKTTFARSLARKGAVHLCIDAWMIRLFGRELPRPEFERKLSACFELMVELAGDIAVTGRAVVLDAGFWHRPRRVSARARLEARGVPTMLRYCSVPDEERWARLERRNRALPDDEYEITREMFEHFGRCFEPPEADESPQIVASSSLPPA